MSEETSLTGEMVKQSKEVLGKAYDDLIHPTAKPVGNIISLLPRTIGVWLGKWEKWIINGEESIRLTAEAVKEKAEKIPEEKLTEPEPYVAVPAIQQLSYCYDSEELREMYANLLVASMNTDTKNQVHPSFVDIIKQLTPDEAKLLKKISKPLKNTYYPYIDLRAKSPDGGYRTIIKHFTDIADDVCDYPPGVFSYLENLSRLGIISFSDIEHIVDSTQYDSLEKHEAITGLKERPLPEGWVYETAKGLFTITSFGKSFIRTCII